jgi:hypothetical protein
VVQLESSHQMSQEGDVAWEKRWRFFFFCKGRQLNDRWMRRIGFVKGCPDNAAWYRAVQKNAPSQVGIRQPIALDWGAEGK